MERLGIIGGSGVYKIEGIEIKAKVDMETPFGKPSEQFIIGVLNSREVVFVPRHGQGHRFSPAEINYRANIYGMKKLGVTHIISVTACGSLKEGIRPLDFAIPLQFVNRTNQARKCTFFDRGIACHISLAHPVCKNLSEILCSSAKEVLKDKGANVHFGVTYLNMEGPQFSTFAESMLYKHWDMDIIGMTNMTEAALAREAEICYATLASVTDYDCWHETEEEVSIEVVINNLKKNVENAKLILEKTIPEIPLGKKCTCHSALENAIITDPDAITPEIRKRVGIFIDKYIK